MKIGHPIVLGKHGIFFIFSILFVLVALFVFKANDESQPIIEILKWNYLIPVFIYAIGTIGVSYFLFLLLRKKLSNVISLILSIIIGLPAGLQLMVVLISLISRF